MFCLRIRQPPRPTLFPNGTAFRPGDEPALVDRVAREAAADLVVHPAARHRAERARGHRAFPAAQEELDRRRGRKLDRKSTRLNSSHANISYAVFCLKKNILTSSTA